MDTTDEIELESLSKSSLIALVKTIRDKNRSLNECDLKSTMNLALAKQWMNVRTNLIVHLINIVTVHN